MSNSSFIRTNFDENLSDCHQCLSGFVLRYTNFFRIHQFRGEGAGLWPQSFQESSDFQGLGDYPVQNSSARGDGHLKAFPCGHSPDRLGVPWTLTGAPRHFLDFMCGQQEHCRLKAPFSAVSTKNVPRRPVNHPQLDARSKRVRAFFFFCSRIPNSEIRKFSDSKRWESLLDFIYRDVAALLFSLAEKFVQFA